MDLHRQILPPAERAADPGEVQPHLVGLEPQARRDLVAVDVQPLGGDVDVHASFPVRDTEPGLGPEERLILHAELVDARHGHVPLRLGITVADDEVADDVRPRVVAVAVPHRGPVRVEGLRLEGLLGIDDRLERLVLDQDPVGRATGLLGVLGGHDRHRLAEVAHAVEREHGLVRELEAVAPLAGDVVAREHRVHAGHGDRFADVEREDPGVRVRAPDGDAPEHSGCVEVACVGELAGHLGDAVGAQHDLTDASDLEGLRRRAHAPAASRTASKIFW